MSDDGVSSSPASSGILQLPKPIAITPIIPDASSNTTTPNRPLAPCRGSRGEATLHHTFPAQNGQYELQVMVQPENQHRARYQTEGSRGAIKDQSQTAFPKVKVSIMS